MGRQKKQKTTKYQIIAAKSIIFFAISITAVAGMLCFSSMRDTHDFKDHYVDHVENKTLAYDQEITTSTEIDRNEQINDIETTIESTESETINITKEQSTESTTVNQTTDADLTKIEENNESATNQTEETAEHESEIDETLEDEDIEHTSNGFESVTEMVIVTVNLNVRKGPGIDYDIVDTVEEGSVVKRIGIGNNGWDILIYNDQLVYAKGEYLELMSE